MLKNKGGFTLIELVMIIVILGILAAVAIPKYADLKGEADKSNGKAIVGALNSAASVAFAQFLTNGTNTTARCDGAVTGYIDTAAKLRDCLDGGLPKGWDVSGDNFTYVDSGGTTHTFPTFDETASAKARVQRTDAGGWPE